MHKAILAAVASTALFAPAVAEQINMNGPSQAGQEMQQQQSQPMPGPSQATASHGISPKLLSALQIRDLQQALQARGAHSIRVDGEWSADMEAAISNFQKSANMISQNGELDSLTLMALGLDPLSFGLSGESETTGQAVRDGASSPERMQEAPGQQPSRDGEKDR